jgi:KDO2-lipid IV(A) lauroyltransferase
MLENFWNKLSFDLLPTLPVDFGLWRLALLALVAIVPAYIAWAKTSIERKWLYRFSILEFAALAACVFVPVEDFYFDRGSLTVFAKTLYALLLLGALLDRDDMKSYPYRKKGFFKKYVRHPAEAIAAALFCLLFKVLPATWASALGGALGRFAGRFQGGYNRLIEANLGIAFPKMQRREREKVQRGMWDMLGRYCAEPAHFSHMLRNHKKYLKFEGDGILEKLKGKPYVAFIAHCGTLGLVAVPFALRKMPCSIIYKYPSNNLADGFVTKSFGRGIGSLSFIPNAGNGTKDAMRVLSNGGGILVVPDQKFHSGVPTKFFGAKVKSPAGAARLAAHFNCPLLPIQLVRTGGLRHKIVFHEPFMPANTGNKEQDAAKTTQRINNVVEGWIRENPAQWFWVHDRWGIKDKLEEHE